MTQKNKKLTYKEKRQIALSLFGSRKDEDDCLNVITRESNNEHLLEKINKYFCEDNKSFNDISYNQLMWYLGTLFIWYEFTNSRLKEKESLS